MRIKVSFEIVTEDSIRHGDAQERGWENEEGETFGTVSEAVDWLKRQGPLQASSSEFSDNLWYSGQVVEDRAFFEKGESRTLSYHLTEASPDELRAVYDAVVHGIVPEDEPEEDLTP
jgi:hypothetical protein